MRNKYFRTIYICWLSFKGTFTNLSLVDYFVTKLVYPFFQLLFFVSIALFANDEADVFKLVVGNAVILCTFSCIFDMGLIFVRDRYFGTLRYLVINEEKILKVFLERGLFYILDTSLTVISGFIAGYIFFGLSLENIQLLTVFVIVGISLLSGISIGFF